MTKIYKKKWLFVSLLVFSALILSLSLFIDFELKKMYGGFTKKVESLQFLEGKQNVIAIQNVNVLASNCKSFLGNKTVLIADGEILAIVDSVSIPKESLVIDGSGKYLIPGLIDAHVHLWQSPNDLLLYLANGVTTIYEVKGFDFQLDWKNEIAAGDRLGPNLLVASTKLQTNDFFYGMFLRRMQGDINANDPDKAYGIVKEIKEAGYHALKVGSHLSEENYKAIDEAARKLGFPLIGHFPYKMKLSELYQSTQRNVAHIEEFVKNLNYQFGRVDASNCEDFLSFVATEGPKIAEQLKQRNISVTTTLMLMESIKSSKVSVEKTIGKVALEYENPGLMEGTIMTSRALGWLPEVNTYRRSGDLTTDQVKNSDAFWDTYVKANKMFLNYFLDAGVMILAGTDANVPPAVPGFSLHEELISLNNAGMSPSQVLQSATANSAAYLKLNKGKIEVGLDADLVLLSENPLEEIRNTSTVESVILRGQIYTQMELNVMLEAVKDANKRSRKESIDVFLKSDKSASSASNI